MTPLPRTGFWLRLARAVVGAWRERPPVGETIAHGPELPGVPRDPNVPPIVAPPDAPPLSDGGRKL
jgi:hypothetical protein